MQFEPLFHVMIYSHYVKIMNPTPRVDSLLKYYCHRLTSRIFTKERGKWITKPDKLYGYRSPDGSEYRFHINTWTAIVDYLKTNHIYENLYTTEKVPLDFGVKVDLPVKEHFKPRDYQVPIIDYAIKFDDPIAKLIGIYTGGGKTSTALMSLSKIGRRFAVIIKPGYIEKWFSDVLNILDIKREDILVVQGSDQLRGLIDMANNNCMHAKVIIISNRTYQNYLKAYELETSASKTGSTGYGSYDGWRMVETSIVSDDYGCHPENLFRLLGLGAWLIDEVHQEFYGNFKTHLYTNLPITISLSATLLNNNPFMEKVYEIAYPKASRYDSLKMNKYIKVYPVAYRFKEPERIRVTEFGSTNYSHVAFEKSIMYRPFVLKPYMGMIAFLVDTAYIKDFKPGDKVLIFASTIKLCTLLTNFLKSRYPDKDVRRYVEDDPYENIIEGEITVTTLMSGGTAVDIPGLRALINTINVDSAQSNLQGMGRLRELTDRDVKYYYTYCEQLKKHTDYNERRQNLIRESVASIKPVSYGYSI